MCSNCSSPNCNITADHFFILSARHAAWALGEHGLAASYFTGIGYEPASAQQCQAPARAWESTFLFCSQRLSLLQMAQNEPAILSPTIKRITRTPQATMLASTRSLAVFRRSSCAFDKMSSSSLIEAALDPCNDWRKIFIDLSFQWQ